MRSDLSHTARILPSHETRGLPSPSRPPSPPPHNIINPKNTFVIPDFIPVDIVFANDPSGSVRFPMHDVLCKYLPAMVRE